MPVDTPCDEYPGYRNPQGYGIHGGNVLGERRAHRRAWVAEHGPIPDGMHVLHRCDNPPCRRVDHLFLGSHRANMQDCAGKGRQKQQDGERNANAKLTEEQVQAIRESAATQPALAEQYGVNQSTISRIRGGKRRASAPA